MHVVTHLVFIILRKDPIELDLVTICALPVQSSVTTITGHENVKNSSKDEKRWPHVLSNLFPNHH